MRDELRKAIPLTNPCQRNWDHTKKIPEEDLQLLVDSIVHSPTKQNERHYKLFYTTNPDLIYSIYDKTKRFTVLSENDTSHTRNDGRVEDDYRVRNSQVNANALFVICDDWDQETCRNMEIKIIDERPHEVESNVIHEKEMLRFYGIGIAAGELILTANLLGYRTGLCSGFNPNDMSPFFNNNRARLLIGVGIPHPNKDRTEHEEVLNKDIVVEDERTGNDDEKWQFPSFEKEMHVIRL